MKTGLQHSQSKWRLQVSYGLLIVFCVILSIMMLSWSLWRSHDQARSEFTRWSHQVAQQIKVSMSVNETILDGFAAFLADVGMQDPNRARFYVRSMLERYPQLYMFQAAQRVPSDEVSEFEVRLSQQLGESIQVRQFLFGKGLVPVSTVTAVDYYPVVFVEPTFLDGLNILGLDISSIQFIEDAMKEALRTQLAVVSQVIELSDGSEAFVLIKPSLLPGQDIPDQYALAVVKTQALLADIIGMQGGVSLSLGYRNKAPILAHQADVASELDRWFLSRFEYEEAIPVGANPMMLSFQRQMRLEDLSLGLVLIILVFTIVGLWLIRTFMVMHLKGEEEKQRNALRLYQQANFDRLTGLANRHFFEDYFARALVRCERHSERIALLYLDLNDFKPINDEHGHQVGDAVLATFSAIILQATRGDDIACRFGGDEFVILLHNIHSETDVERVVKRLTDLMEEIKFIEGKSMTLSASVGHSLYPEDGDDFDSLIKTADDRMYQMKRKSKAKGRLILMPRR